MKIKGAIFDMDGTLIDSLIFFGILWAAISRQYLNGAPFQPDAETDKTIRTIPLRDSVELIHRRYGIGQSCQELFAFTQGLMETFYREQVLPKPGVKEFLEGLKNRGVKMCVASASEIPMLQIALKRCGLDGYFSGLFSSKDFGVGKDQPDVFLAALNHLGTPPEETWVFEDSYVALRCAHDIGLKTVGIHDPFNYNQDQMAALANEYIGEGQQLTRLLKDEH